MGRSYKAIKTALYANLRRLGVSPRDLTLAVQAAPGSNLFSLDLSGQTVQNNGAVAKNRELIFSNADYLAPSVDPIGSGAYTKIIRYRVTTQAAYNNLISSSNSSHVLWAPDISSWQYDNQLAAGHNGTWNYVRDETITPVLGRKYVGAVTFDPNVSSGKMTLYRDGLLVDTATGVPTQITPITTYIGRFSSGYTLQGAIDYVLLFDAALTNRQIKAISDEIDRLFVVVDDWSLMSPSSILLPINVTGSLPAQTGTLTLKKSYHRSVGGTL